MSELTGRVKQFRPRKSSLLFPYVIVFMLKVWNNKPLKRMKFIRIAPCDVYDEGDHFTLVIDGKYPESPTIGLIRVNKSDIVNMVAECNVDFLGRRKRPRKSEFKKVNVVR